VDFSGNSAMARQSSNLTASTNLYRKVLSLCIFLPILAKSGSSIFRFLHFSTSIEFGKTIRNKGIRVILGETREGQKGIRIPLSPPLFKAVLQASIISNLVADGIATESTRC